MKESTHKILYFTAAALLGTVIVAGCNTASEKSGAKSASALKEQHISEAVNADGEVSLKRHESTLPFPYAFAGSRTLHETLSFTKYGGSDARIYGSYNAGCIEGTVEITPDKYDFAVQTMSLQRKRNFAHPVTEQFLKDLAVNAEKAGLSQLVIGDLSQRAGGPLGPNSNHASHTTGLDIDIPFSFNDGKTDINKDVYIVKNREVTENFTADTEKLIMLAAADPRVDRIFVAPMIKKHLCELYADRPENTPLLRRLRPWFGHKAHMHVRLSCPFDSKECITQKAPPAGNGCGYEVESWFLPPPVQTAGSGSKKKSRGKVQLPEKCTLILQAANNSKEKSL